MMELNDKKYLGRICKRGHDYNNTGHSLRLKDNGGCYQCILDKFRDKSKNIILRSNSFKYKGYSPSEEEKLKYEEARHPEIWKNVTGTIKKINFDSLSKIYQVSSWGRVRYIKNRLDDWFYLKSNITGEYCYVRIKLFKIMLMIEN